MQNRVKKSILLSLTLSTLLVFYFLFHEISTGWLFRLLSPEIEVFSENNTVLVSLTIQSMGAQNGSVAHFDVHVIGNGIELGAISHPDPNSIGNYKSQFQLPFGGVYNVTVNLVFCDNTESLFLTKRQSITGGSQILEIDALPRDDRKKEQLPLCQLKDLTKYEYLPGVTDISNPRKWRPLNCRLETHRHRSRVLAEIKKLFPDKQKKVWIRFFGDSNTRILYYFITYFLDIKPLKTEHLDKNTQMATVVDNLIFTYDQHYPSSEIKASMNLTLNKFMDQANIFASSREMFNITKPNYVFTTAGLHNCELFTRNHMRMYLNKWAKVNDGYLFKEDRFSLLLSPATDVLKIPTDQPQLERKYLCQNNYRLHQRNQALMSELKNLSNGKSIPIVDQFSSTLLLSQTNRMMDAAHFVDRDYEAQWAQVWVIIQAVARRI